MTDKPKDGLDLAGMVARPHKPRINELYRSKGRPTRVDLRQTDFLFNYLNPKSKTYNNIYQSAVNAGYSKEYADNFRIKELNWVSDSVGMVTKDKLIKKAKNNLDKLLDSLDEKIRADITKFVAKTDVEFSEKQETTINLPQPILGGLTQNNTKDDIKD